MILDKATAKKGCQCSQSTVLLSDLKKQQCYLYQCFPLHLHVSGRNSQNSDVFTKRTENVILEMFSRQGQRKKCVEVLAGQSSISERRFVPGGVTGLP